MAPTAEEWIAQFAEALGQPAPDGAQMTAVLELASVAAHSSERRAAPIACWLAARAGRDLGGRAARSRSRSAKARLRPRQRLRIVDPGQLARAGRDVRDAPSSASTSRTAASRGEPGAQHGERGGLVARGERLAARGRDAVGPRRAARSGRA